ncbi:hypothetical protein HBZC1_00860 [Helicobacter bizzozeronii CIII-1]|uniref:Periplasmic protein n=1 Tax=Helicobacter bizzozeronii (strain CIII-1) TaxID=1002804 RepID=F8KQR8_HELBC|nr:hypothetical protein [Helicobacter bizzozeronii]CCB79072.1 hypothetical protein HBZC1_00860 [Helicobacter bizzozeronii CIII-1]
MTRLICILLFISPLWAVSVDLVQEMQQARALVVKIYYQDFKERCDRVDNGMVYSHAMQREAPALVKHLKAFVNHIPLLQSFQPKTPQQARAIQALKALEMFNLAALLRDSTPGIDDCNDSPEHPERVKPFNAKKNASKFLKNIEVIYAPLLEAYYQGLDMADYLQALHAKFDPLFLYNYWSNMQTQEDILNMTKGAKTPTMRHFFKDFAYINVRNDLSGYNTNIFDVEPTSQNFLQDQIISVMGVKVQDLELWVTYYQARTKTFLGNSADQYTSNMGHYWEIVTNVRAMKNPCGNGLMFGGNGLISAGDPSFHNFVEAMKDMTAAMQLTLPKNPTPCLQPQYLNQEAKAVCLQIFQQHSYNPKPLQKYLKSLRLISIDNAPCVYLNASDKLQLFKSSNALCLTLQTNLKKEFK